MPEKIKIKISEFLPYILSAIGVILTILIVYTIVNTAKKEIITYKTEEGNEIYFYLSDIKFEYSSKITISSENEIVKLTTGNYEHDFDSEPIYFKGKKEVLFPKEMSVILTRNSFIQKKINKFTKIIENDVYYLQNKNLNYKLESAVLYDGKDLFFFLNPTTINIGGYSIEISAFSYVVFNYNKELFIYDYEDDKMHYFEDVTEQVLATNKDYTIDLGIDGIIHQDGAKLLMKNFEYLSKLKEE